MTIEQDEQGFFKGLDVNTATVEEIRQSTIIEIVADKDMCKTYVGQVMLEVAVNLSSRLMPRVMISVPEDMYSIQSKRRLIDHLESVRDSVRFWDQRASGSDKHVRLVIGGGSTDFPSVYINASGWLVGIGPEPIRLEPTNDCNPTGAVAAACLGVAEIFKHLFGRFVGRTGQISGVQIYDTPTVMSTYSYEWGGPEDHFENPEVQAVNVDRTVLFGVGSVGASLLYTLSFIPDLSGNLFLVDKDSKLDEHNMLRYSFLIRNDLQTFKDTGKVTWAKEKISRRCAKLEIIPFEGSVQDWLDQQPADYRLQLAISAVDSAAARRDITDVMAETTINAGTGTTNLEVSRHGFGNSRGCLYCKYIGQVAPNIAEARDYATMSGLPLERVVKLLESDKLSENDLKLMVSQGKLHPELRSYWLDGQLRSLARQHLYSQIQLNDRTEQKIITLAFVSTAAGALLVGEMIKNQMGAEVPLGYEFRTDLLKRVNLPLLPVAANPRCLCNHSFRLGIYRSKYRYPEFKYL